MDLAARFARLTAFPDVDVLDPLFSPDSDHSSFQF